MGSFNVPLQIPSSLSTSASVVTLQTPTTTLLTVAVPNTTSTVVLNGLVSFNATTGTNAGLFSYTLLIKKVLTPTTSIQILSSQTTSTVSSGFASTTQQFTTSTTGITLQVNGLATTTINWRVVNTAISSF